MELNKIAVMGAGLMGTGITQVVASGGYPVYIRDISADILGKSKAKIEGSLKKAAGKGRISEEDVNDILGRITFTEDINEALADTDLVVEAVPEILDLKKKVFSEMEKVADPATIFATNTGELSIARIADAISVKDRVIGTHWFFPPTVMKLIEVVVAPETSQETIDTTVAFCKNVGKATVLCKDSSGFITSRAIAALKAECFRIYEEGIATPEDIDTAMRLGFNHPMGPFEMTDMIGLDTVYNGMMGMYEVYGDRYKPTETMKKLVENGDLGQKTGKGFYNHKK